MQVLHISPLLLARVTCGHVINLVSNDARRLDEVNSKGHSHSRHVYLISKYAKGSHILILEDP